MTFLLVENGPEAGKKYSLGTANTILGRHPECHIVIEVGAVSRYHAQISQDNDQYFVEDLKSRNGTFLNDKPVQGKQLLRSGDHIRVCDIGFMYYGDDADQIDTLDSTGTQSSFAIMDDGGSGSTIMSKLDVSSRGGLQITASAEAKLAALLEINSGLAKALKLDDVLPNVLECLFRIFVQADRGFIVLKGANGELIPRWMKTRREGQAETVRISRTIVHEVMRAKEAILSADATSDNRFEMSQSIADFRIRSMMCAPLLDGEGEPLGVIQIDTVDQRKRFETEDLEILVAVAAQAGIAVNNATLHEQALRQRDVERDLALAHEVQRGFLPTQPPNLPGYAFFDYYEPANEVGGDYYDYILLRDGRVAVVVADVVGHGVAAALLMAKLSAETRYCLASQPDAAGALTELNHRFCGPRTDRFVTIVMAIIDPLQHTVTIVNAGHMAPIWSRSNNELLDVGDEIANIPIGIADGIQYEQVVIRLEPGETLTLFTDGVNESMDVDDVFYGIDRIRDIITKHCGDVSAAGKELVEDVRRHIGAASQYDDMCLVCFGRCRSPGDSA